MRPLSNIFSKEVRELLTPATVLPIVVLAILFGSLGGIMGDVGGEASKPPIIGIIQQDDSELHTTGRQRTGELHGHDIGQRVRCRLQEHRHSQHR